jgi:hypothetical protein
LPKPFQYIAVARRIHRVPEAAMVEGAQLVIRR